MTTKRKPALMLTALLALALCLMLAVCVLTACNDSGSGNQDGGVAKPFANNTPVPTKLLNALFYYTYTNGSNQQAYSYLLELCYSDAAYIDETYDNSLIYISHAQLNEGGQISGVSVDFHATIHADNVSAQEHFDKGDYTSGPYTDIVDPESFVYENTVVTVSAESGFADLLNSSAPLAIRDNENIGKIMGAMPSATGKSVFVRFGGDSHDFEATILQSISPEYGADSRLEKWSSFRYAYPGETFDAETSESADSLTQSFKQMYNDSTNWSCSVERTAASLEIECATKPGVTYRSNYDWYTVDEFCYDADHRPAEVTVPAEINGLRVSFDYVQLPSFVTDLYLPGRDISVIRNSTIDDFRYEGDTTLLTIHGDDWVYQLGDGADNTIADIAILVPAADHGWMGAVLGYATEWAAEINAEGTYSAAVVTATSREPQMEQIEDIAAARTYKAVVILSIDSSVETSLRILAEADIPFIMVDRIIDGVADDAVATVRGNDYQIGYLTGERFIEQGLVIGDNVLIIPGDNSNVSLTRTEGFYAALEELKGITPDNTTFTQLNPTYWARVIANREFADFINRTDDFADYDFIFTHDDEIAMGVIEALDGTEIDSTKKELFFGNGDEVVIASCGGLNEVYEILRGTSYADIYTNLKDLFDVTYPSSMIINALDMMVAHLDGETTDDVVIHSAIVDAGNVGNLQGYN